MASNMTLPSFQGPLLKSNFLGRNDLSNHAQKSSFAIHKQRSTHSLRPCAKFNLSEILGGRGLCNGEAGLLQELTKNVQEQTNVEEQVVSAATPTDTEEEKSDGSAITTIESFQEDGFDKELMGLTGGFPGGEKGLQKFIEKNPPPKKLSVAGSSGPTAALVSSKRPEAPELPLLLPGMIAIVNNPNSPYYMYCGIVQRITDGKAGVLFEGGNWDRLITFRLGELLRRDKGPPGKNPKSAVLEPFLQRDPE